MKKTPPLPLLLLICFSAVSSLQAHPGHAPHVHPFTVEEGLVLLAAIGLWIAWRAFRAKRLTK